MDTTLIEKIRKTFQKIAFIKQAIASGMTLEQAIQASKNQNG